jgi:hypothetical protein
VIAFLAINIFLFIQLLLRRPPGFLAKIVDDTHNIVFVLHELVIAALIAFVLCLFFVHIDELLEEEEVLFVVVLWGCLQMPIILLDLHLRG